MAASAKTDYSASVPDPSTLVGPGGVEHHIVRVRGLPWSCTGMTDIFQFTGLLIAALFTENELIEFFEGVCIQSVHFTRDRSFERYIYLLNCGHFDTPPCFFFYISTDFCTQGWQAQW